ncbi:permease [Nakamurella leprariae]|uniref:Permease n=1 Tax=Nakamurella leprariae TaxID=2803911 RepID=A0A939BYJ2_9ACTN|nr:permease [Nakamurella leprariae]MBM9467140.1 permease [Nakamurella leprariae]
MTGPDGGGADTTTTRPGSGPSGGLARRGRSGYRPGSLEMLGAVLLLGVLLKGPLERLLDRPVLQTWSTVFVAVIVQATPFLVLGVIVSGAIAAFVPARVFQKLLPKRPALAVPVAGAAGIALPGCECGSVPIANRLIDRGVPASAALAFLLSAPAVNPIVLVATAIAFPTEPSMVWARLVAGLATALIVGWIWQRIGKPQWLVPRRALELDGTDRPATAAGRWRLFVGTMLGDFAQAAGFLVIGAAAAATFNVLARRWMDEHIASSILLSILLMAALAFILALCSEADAFVAAAFSTIPMVGKLVFLTVGPAVDVKLVAMQAGTFGKRFAVRFAPLTFVVAVVVGTATGLLFWGGWS